MSNQQKEQAFNRATGQALQAARVSASLSHADVADASGVAEDTLRSFEKGEVALDVFSLYRLSVVLGVTAPALLGAAIRLFEDYEDSDTLADRETREASELIRHFLHVEGPSRGEKFTHLVSELKKSD